jgi:phenylacetate-CoA ligase
VTAARRVQGTLTILRHLPGQRRAQFQARARLEAARDRRVRRAVEHAARHVPYYRELFRSRDIDPAQIRTAEELARLPLLTKEDVQAAGEQLRAETPADVVEFRTTGSTATPLTIHHDRASLLANIAYSERERAVEASIVGRRYRYRVLALRALGGTGGRVQSFYGQTSFRPFRPDRQALDVGTPVEQVLETVERQRPDVIRSYGAYLEFLFRYAAASAGLQHRPRAVVYAGDTMSPAGRALIETEFGIPVLSNYNAVEAFKIAFTCGSHGGFHLHEDLCHVRLVGPTGEPVPDGERGEVVVSNLVNRGTVLLNYRLADLARIESGPCDCGRTSRRLVDLEGRVDDVLDLGGNVFVYPTQVWQAFRSRPGILRYQLVQRAPRTFELKVVWAEPEAPAEAAAELAADLRTILHSSDVAVSPCDDLPTAPGGKFRQVIPFRGDGA